MTNPPTGGRIAAERQDDVLVVRISNPGRANALDDAMLDALASALSGPGVASARAVVLTGEGDRNFSGGVDLSGRPMERLADSVREGERLLGRAAAAVLSCPVPVVCALNGNCYGGALEIAMACDWRIARRGARFAMPPARLGWVYAAEGIRLFVRAVGPAHTLEMFLTGTPVEADRAREIGLVSHVVEPEGLMPAAMDAASAIAANGPIAVAGTRAVIRAIAGDPGAGDPGAVAAEWRGRAFGSADLAEGLTAFREKRPPRFSGS